VAVIRDLRRMTDCCSEAGIRPEGPMTPATEAAAGRSEHGPFLRARPFRPHHGLLFRRVRIGRRSDACGSHSLGTSAGVEGWKSNHCVAHLSAEARQLWDQLREEWMSC